MVKAARSIPEAVRSAQHRASDPKASSFVSANAGSGKTHVLVQRVIRLLLEEVDPQRILCITFTKAAAANMSERVFSTLGHWITLDDDALDAAIRSTGIIEVTSRLRQTARKLFASALETPGGLKVQTIHALCTRLLQQFPFEAKVPARFAVLDDRDQAEMMERANLAVLLEASRNPDSPLGRALTTAMTSAADVTFKDVVREACLSRDHFLAWTDAAGSVEAASAQLSAALGVNEDDRLDALEREIVDGPHMPRSEWQAIAAALDTGSKNDKGQAGQLRTALRDSGSSQVTEYINLFLNGDGDPRASVVTKGFATANPAVAGLIAAEVRRLGPLILRRRALILRDRSRALLRIATAVAAHYRREKQERGLLDYDDLIDRTLAMFNSVSASWVHYKLDRGVDHVLIDEAQDTSPRQWDIVFHLIDEFTSGAGAREGVHRTIFAVGDEKQSIFSFQGAAPRQFDERKRSLHRRFREAGLKFDPVNFNYSFRSGAAILHSVDQVFRDDFVYKSIHSVDIGPPVHNALTDAGPGLIELWDLARPDEREEIEGWRAPFDGVSVTSPEVKLARRVQAEIRRLVDSGAMKGPRSARTPISYGDVLILVRRRGNIFDAVIQALKHADIPVAGADRLKLTEHIAIIDLMNLADALLCPADDLALAVALKSPLFGLEEQELFDLCWQRRGSLRDALDAHAATSGRLATIRDRLVECEQRAARQTPFGFYAWLLGGDGGRARILKRLGHEANDALDEFLELALGHERKAPASLQGFMAWLRTADTEVKRDMEISRDEVRVMTVHGAKGLEASVVFMVDTTSSPSDTQRLRLIHLPHGDGKVVVWAAKKTEDPPAVALARQAMLDETEDEYRRLLYVAMTRAADRLIVGGCKPGNRTDIRPLCWYDLIEKGLSASGLQEQKLDCPDGSSVRRFTRAEEGASETGPAASRQPGPTEALPDWLRLPAALPAAADRRLRPSDSGGATAGRRAGGRDFQLDRAAAMLRGTLVHRLLQSLPELPDDRRRGAADSFLARNAADWTDAERQALADGVLAIITAPRFAPAFADGSRAEVSIAGRLPGPDGAPVLVSGQIDRLVVTDSSILIVDFKTNQVPPKTAADAPQAYVRQLALYRAVLARMYPDRTIRAALLWTETPEWMEIPASALDAELLCLTRPGE